MGHGADGHPLWVKCWGRAVAGWFSSSYWWHHGNVWGGGLNSWHASIQLVFNKTNNKCLPDNGQTVLLISIQLLALNNIIKTNKNSLAFNTFLHNNEIKNHLPLKHFTRHFSVLLMCSGILFGELSPSAAVWFFCGTYVGMWITPPSFDVPHLLVRRSAYHGSRLRYFFCNSFVNVHLRIGHFLSCSGAMCYCRQASCLLCHLAVAEGNDSDTVWPMIAWRVCTLLANVGVQSGVTSRGRSKQCKNAHSDWRL